MKPYQFNSGFIPIAPTHENFIKIDFHHLESHMMECGKCNRIYNLFCLYRENIHAALAPRLISTAAVFTLGLVALGHFFN